MQVEHDELETKIKEGENQLIVKREEYLKFNKACFQIDAFHFRKLKISLSLLELSLDSAASSRWHIETINLKFNISEKNSSPWLKEHSKHSKKNFMSEQNI